MAQWYHLVSENMNTSDLGNGLSLIWGQAITKANDDLLSIDLIHKAHNAPVTHPMMHQSHIPQCTIL